MQQTEGVCVCVLGSSHKRCVYSVLLSTVLFPGVGVMVD